MTRRRLEVERLRPWLEAVAEISKLVNTISHDGLLDLIARRTAELTRQDFCAVQMKDDTAQRLLIVGSYGLSDLYITEVNTDKPIGLVPGSDFYDSPSSRAFRSSGPVLIADVEGATSFSPWRQLAKEQGYRSILAVPMLVTGEVVGVIACYSRRTGALDASEVAGVELMAEQAALAIHTAELRSREARAKAQVERSNRLLVKHQKALERAERAHRELMHMVLAGRDLQAIAQELSSSLGAPVAIEDIANRSVVHAPVEGPQIQMPERADRDRPDAPARRRDANRVVAYRSEEPTGPRRLHVCPVIAGGELIGRLWIQPSTPRLDPADRRTVEGAALVIAMEMLKRRAALEVELRLSGDVLSDLLLVDGRHGPRDLINLARQIGHDPGIRHQVLVAQFTGAAGHQPPNAADHHMVTAALQATDGIRPKPVIGLRQNVGVLLLPLVSNSTRSPQQVAGHWHEALLQYGHACVVTGDVVSEMAGYPHAFEVACGALRLMTWDGEAGGVRDLSEFGLFTLLLRSSDPQPLQDFARDRLAAVHTYDRNRGTELLITLRAYLRHGGRTGEVARELTVHPNTVLNRVSRLEELLQTDLNDPRGRLEIQLALMIDSIGQVNTFWSTTRPLRGPVL